MTVPTPLPAPAFPNGFRAQATVGDARAERLVRAVRMEVADLRQVIDAWGEGREDMLDVDIAAVSANPAAAAALPPATLARALAAAADRIAGLERALSDRDREASRLAGELARLTETHSYARGRMEMLEEVIAALHANLEDFRYERNLRGQIEPPAAHHALTGEGPRDSHSNGGGAFG